MAEGQDSESSGNRGMLHMRADRALYTLVAALFLGIGIGWVVGRTEGEASALAKLRAAVPVAVVQGTPGLVAPVPVPVPAPGADADLLARTNALSARVDSLESLLALAEQLNLEPRQLAEAAISQLSEEQIRGALGSVMRLDPEEIDAIDDVPAYASRLAGLALEGVVEPDPLESGGASGEVVFALELDRRDPESLALSSFGQDAGRVYAVFDVGDYQGGKVMVKWYNSDTPELLLFRHYRLAPEEDFSWVWHGPEDGWATGRYRVDVFQGDESLERIASGEFDVR